VQIDGDASASTKSLQNHYQHRAESILIVQSKDEAFVAGPIEIATNAFHHLVVHQVGVV